MKKEFTANILFLIAINLVIKPFYALAIDTSVQNEVGPENYGLFLALFNFVYIQQIFADLGIQNYNNRTISRNPKLLGELLPNILGSKIVFTLAFGLIVYFTASIFNYNRYFNEILVWIIGTQACLSFLLYCRTNISGLGRYYTDSIFSVLDKLILIIWMSYLLWIEPPQGGLMITHFVQAQFYSVSLSLGICLLFTHISLNKLSVSFNYSFIRGLLKESLPYATLVILMAGYSRMDSIMLEQILDDKALEAGKYASSFRLYDTFNNFTFLFAVLLLPMFSRMIAKKENVSDLVVWSVKLLSLGSIFVIIFCYFQGYELLSFFYDREIDDRYINSLNYLLLAGLPLSLNYVFGTLLTANGNLRILNYIAISGFVVNFLLNWFLIPDYGATGAAIATFITQLLVWILQIYFSSRFFTITLPRQTIVSLLLQGLFLAIMMWIFAMYIPLSLFGSIVVFGIFYAVLAFLLKLVSVKDFQIFSLSNK